jgi:ribosomal protein L10
VSLAAGCMGGNKLDSAAVRKLEKLPTKKQLIGSVAIMVKKVGRSPAMYMFHSIMTSRPGCK